MPFGSLDFSDGGWDLGGGISLGGDGSYSGGTFNGGGIDPNYFDFGGSNNWLSNIGNGISGIGNSLAGNLSSGVGLGLGATALSNLVGSYLNNQGIGNAMNTIQQGANTAQNTLGGVYNQQQAMQQPYLQTGAAGAAGLQQAIPYLTSQITNADIQNQLSPNYQFQLQQGQMANQRASNVAGGGLAGNALKGLQDYTQNFAQGAYQDAFKNALAQKQNIYNTLSGIAGIGQTGANQLTQAGNAYGGNVSNLQSSLAQALAQGQTAQAQTNAGALQSLGNTALMAGMMNQAQGNQNATLAALGRLGSGGNQPINIYNGSGGGGGGAGGVGGLVNNLVGGGGGLGGLVNSGLGALSDIGGAFGF